jgi:drug/metabolite transporter (DMT)-like permease
VAAPDLVRGGAQSLQGTAAFGDLLAIGGAVTAAGYYVVGRRLRASLDLWAYVALVYGACFVALLIIALFTQTPLFPYESRDFGIFALLALGPMMLGHTGLNWALRYARAYQVNIVLLGEPIGAALIAASLPSIREQPSMVTVLGGVLILGGIVLAEQRNRS